MINVTYTKDKYIPAKQQNSKLFKLEQETITISMQTEDNLEMNKIMFLAGWNMDTITTA